MRLVTFLVMIGLALAIYGCSPTGSVFADLGLAILGATLGGLFFEGLFFGEVRIKVKDEDSE